MDVLAKLRFIVEPVVFLSFMTMSMEVSLVQQLIRRKVCLVEGMPNCDGKASVELIGLASPWFGAYNITLSLVTFITGLWFGSWADKYGRKKMMIIPFIGSIISTLIFIMASIFMKSTPLTLMISALVIGLSTGTLGVCSTCFGLISTVVSAEQRSTRIAVLEAMVFTGSAAGFYIVSVFLPLSSFLWVFGFELCVHFIGLAYVIGVIQEPIEDLELQRQASPTSVLSLQHIISMCRTVFRRRERHLRQAIVLLIFSSFMLAFGLATSSQLTFTRLSSPPFRWTSSDYSSYHGLMVFVQGFSLVLVLPLCLRFLDMADTTSGLLGALSRLLGLTSLAFATEDWMLYMTIGLFSLSEFAMPSIRSIFSKIVDPQEKSQIFAFMSAQQSLAYVLTGIILLFPGSLTTLFPGFGMAIGALFQIVPISTLLYLKFSVRIDLASQPQTELHQPPDYGSIAALGVRGESKETASTFQNDSC